MVEAVRVPAHLAPPGSLQAKQLYHLHTQLSLGQSCHRQKKKKSLAFVRAESLWSCLTLCDPVACQASLSEKGFSTIEYWSILAKTGCHILLEHYTSKYLSRQPPWVPGSARTPMTQAAAPPPHLALTGEIPIPPGQPQQLNPSGWPTCRDGNKATVETQGQCG